MIPEKNMHKSVLPDTVILLRQYLKIALTLQEKLKP